MADGGVTQGDTAERVGLAPADAYGAEFTRHVPRAKVLTVRSVMQPGGPKGPVAGQVAAGDRIEAVADRVEAAAQPFAVVDGEARVIGTLDRRAVVDTIIGRGLSTGERRWWPTSHSRAERRGLPACHRRPPPPTCPGLPASPRPDARRSSQEG